VQGEWFPAGLSELEERFWAVAWENWSPAAAFESSERHPERSVSLESAVPVEDALEHFAVETPVDFGVEAESTGEKMTLFRPHWMVVPNRFPRRPMPEQLAFWTFVEP
jgi:hypothetical protein